MLSLSTIGRRPGGHALLVLLAYAAYYVGLFAPVVLGGRLLVSGCDAYIYHYPALFGGRAMWDPLLFGGYPRFADPQVMLWYPLALPLSLTGWEPLWNAFMLAPYVLASCFTYGLVWRLTRSALGAACAGLIFGQCGFMMGHMPHVSIVHGVAWLPLILWSLEELRDRFHRGWLAILALAVACCFLAGHVQMFVYSMALAGAYCAWGLYKAPAGARRYGLASAAGVALGMGLTGVQLWPTSELVPLSDRARFTFQEFSAFSFPLRQAPQFLFPYLYGGTDLAPERLLSIDAPDQYGQAVPYFGAWNCYELAGFCGTLTLVLAMSGLLCRAPTSRAWFWTLAVAAGLILSLGDSTPLAGGMYRLPLLGQFRCPCRFLLWFDLGLAVSAGIGVHALQTAPRARAALAGAVSSLVVLGIAGATWWTAARQKAADDFLSRATRSLPTFVRSAAPWENMAIGLPLLGLSLGLGAFWLWRGLRLRGTGVVLVAIVALDVGQFAWLSGWRLQSPQRDVLRSVPAELADVQTQLARSGERLLSLSTLVQSTQHEWDLDNPLHLEAAPGNTCALWGIAGGFGYTPLSLKRCSQILPHAWPHDIGRVDQLLALRYFLDPVRIRRIHGVEYQDFLAKTPTLGHPPMGSGLSVDFETPPTSATRLCLVTSLGCAVEVGDGTRLAEVIIHTTNGDLPPIDLLAGEHLAENCWERADVRPIVAHRLPPTTDPHPSRDDAGRDFQVRLVATSLPFGSQVKVTGAQLRLVGPPGPCLQPIYLTLVDDETGQFHPIHHVGKAAEHWIKQRALADGSHHIMKNGRRLRRAWLAERVVEMPVEGMLDVVHGRATLPDGSPFEPYKTALVERLAPALAAAPDPDAEATISRYEPERVVVQTRSAAEAFLVLGDVWYPGWQARVDGQEAEIYQTDYVLRGVAVPPGRHEVEFVFQPRSLRVGMAVSGVSLLFLLGMLWIGRRGAKEDRRAPLGSQQDGLGAAAET